MRRAFRVGLWFGVIAALGYMVTRTRRRAQPPELPTGPPQWPPVRTRTPAAGSAAPAAPATPAASPAAPAVEAPPAPPASDGDDILPPRRPAAKKKAARKAAKQAKKAVKKRAARSKRAAAKPRPKAAKGTAAAAKPAAEAPPVPAGRVWVRPQGKVCPESHPVKVKLSSKIFHVPGGLAYDRTQADRCYDTEDNAAAAGFRRSKR